MPTAEIAPLLRSDYDLVILDGHGYLPEETDSPPWIGWPHIDAGSIRDNEGRGINAPAVVLGGCWAGTPEFTEALRSCTDSPVAFLGSDTETEYEHAEVIFDRVIEVLGELGPEPDPEISAIGSLQCARGCSRGTDPQLSESRVGRVAGESIYRDDSEVYAWFSERSAPNARYDRPAILRLAGDVAGKRVLELGCAGGVLTASSPTGELTC